MPRRRSHASQIAILALTLADDSHKVVVNGARKAFKQTTVTTVSRACHLGPSSPALSNEGWTALMCDMIATVHAFILFLSGFSECALARFQAVDVAFFW